MNQFSEECGKWIRRIELLEESLTIGDYSRLVGLLRNLKEKCARLSGEPESQVDCAKLMETLLEESLRLESISRSMEVGPVATELRNLALALLCATPSVLLNQVNERFQVGRTLACGLREAVSP